MRRRYLWSYLPDRRPSRLLLRRRDERRREERPRPSPSPRVRLLSLSLCLVELAFVRLLLRRVSDIRRLPPSPRRLRLLRCPDRLERREDRMAGARLDVAARFLTAGSIIVLAPSPVAPKSTV